MKRDFVYMCAFVGEGMYVIPMKLYTGVPVFLPVCVYVWVMQRELQGYCLRMCRMCVYVRVHTHACTHNT